jgi:hypothetical protein
MIEDLIVKAANIDCMHTINIEPFKEKTKILKQVLNEIEIILHSNEKYAKKMLISVENVIFNYGYETGFNFTFGEEGGGYYFEILPKLVELGEKVFEGNELLPFLREKLRYVWDEPARSNLYKKIDELEKK